MLRNLANEEAAKVLILLDVVRCPKSRSTDKSRTLSYFYNHLAKRIYAQVYRGRNGAGGRRGDDGDGGDDGNRGWYHEVTVEGLSHGTLLSADVGIGGPGGDGGNGGSGGNGGAGAREGNRNGGNGSRGDSGSSGNPGNTGRNGVIKVTPIW